MLRQEVEDQTNTASWTSAARRRDSERERNRTGLTAQVARLGEDLKMWGFKASAQGCADNSRVVLAYNFEKPSYKQSVTPKPPSERNESFSLPTSRKVIIPQDPAERGVKRRFHKTS